MSKHMGISVPVMLLQNQVTLNSWGKQNFYIHCRVHVELVCMKVHALIFLGKLFINFIKFIKWSMLVLNRSLV